MFMFYKCTPFYVGLNRDRLVCVTNTKRLCGELVSGLAPATSDLHMTQSRSCGVASWSGAISFSRKRLECLL